MSYEEIPHTADVKIKALAPELSLVFSDLAAALMQVMYGTDRRGCIIKEITLHGEDTETLLFDFLSEVLFISEVEGIVFSGADVAIENGDLHAVLKGEPFDRARHYGGTEVKGISYSGLTIRHDANGYMAEIVFDV
jgi:SHS2 domain-containing protein